MEAILDTAFQTINRQTAPSRQEILNAISISIEFIDRDDICNMDENIQSFIYYPRIHEHISHFIRVLSCIISQDSIHNNPTNTLCIYFKILDHVRVVWPNSLRHIHSELDYEILKIIILNEFYRDCHFEAIKILHELLYIQNLYQDELCTHDFNFKQFDNL